MNRGRRLHFILSATLLGAGALVLGPGCGSSASSLCSDICDCTGCSDSEMDDCVDDVEDAEKEAGDEGCEDQYDDFISCFAEELECRDGEIDADGCESEATSLAKCLDHPIEVSGGLDPCQRAARHFEDCGIQTGGGGEPGQCTDQTAVFAECLVTKSCDELSNGQGILDCSGNQP
jgi:hypothetical protein